MNNVLLRSITGLFFILSIILPLIFSEISTIVFFSLYALIGLHEFYRLFDKTNSVSVNKNAFFTVGSLTLGIHILVTFDYFPTFFYSISFIAVFVLAILELFRKKQSPIINLSTGAFGILYVIVPFCMAISINHFDNNLFPLLLGMFILIWTNDTFAYLSGRFFGKTKLFERISPKKTWEGTVGGTIVSVLFAVIIAYFSSEQSVTFWIISALIIVPCSILGDLVESMVKRELNVKDTGNILPGHGGILDRFDAALFTIPFFLVWTSFYYYF